MIHDETLYKVRQRPAHSPLLLLPLTLLRVSGLTSTGVVAHRALHHPERGHPLKTPNDFRPGLQRYRGDLTRMTFLVVITTSPTDEGRPEQVNVDFSPTRYERSSELGTRVRT
jgi:hypothetical protein